MLLFIEVKITNNTIGVTYTRVVFIERKGKFKVNYVHFIDEIKGIEARGHNGKVATDN